jgi:hypothetical protein
MSIYHQENQEGRKERRQDVFRKKEIKGNDGRLERKGGRQEKRKAGRKEDAGREEGR